MQKAKSSKKIEEIQDDPDFLAQAKRLKIFTLQDVLETDPRQLKENPEFTYTWYAALLQLLKQEKLLEAYQSRL